MQNKKLTVLTEGGRNFGFGHLSRCISISEYFKKAGVITEYIVDGDDSIQQMLKNQSFVLMDWLNKKSVLQKLQQSSFILIDSLRISGEQIKEIQQLDANIIYIDDEKRKNILDKGFVLDWTVLSDKKNYFFPKKENVTYLLGSKYTPLRRHFKFKDRINISNKVENIFVSFGGSDVRNLTPKVLGLLVEHYPKLKKSIVVGDGFTNLETLKLVQDENTTLIYNAGDKKMSSLMKNSDIAISSGGQTLYELTCLGIPTIAILMIENAREDTEGWNKIGSIDYIGNFDDSDLMKKLLASINRLKKQTRRQKMQSSSKSFKFDGARLIFEAVSKGIK
jgi:UDP-2,4-diacetamido-2,4,6-trideoxy-beta-L-altropyranose hydrolase